MSCWLHKVAQNIHINIKKQDAHVNTQTPYTRSARQIPNEHVTVDFDPTFAIQMPNNM